jgi:hypothetical protein
MNTNLKWELLEQTRAKTRTVLMNKITHNLVEIRAEHLLIPSDCRTRGVTAFKTIYTYKDECISLFILSSYHHHLEQHTTRSTSGQYHQPVPGSAGVHYPSRAVPDVKCSTLFLTVNTISILTVQYGHARSNYIQSWGHSLREEEEEEM